MESPSSPADLIDDVVRTRQRVAQRVEVPAGYDAALAVAVAALVVGAAMAVNHPVAIGIILVLSSAAMMGWQMRRFREHNGLWVSGLRGGSTLIPTILVTVLYVAAVIAATKAGDRGHWWLVAVLAVAMGAIYWCMSKWWMIQYRKANRAS